MNLVDSSGWLEYFTDGAKADIFAPAIEDTANLVVSTINIFEVFKKILRERDENAAVQAVAIMEQGNVIQFSSALALSAAEISHTKKIPMADSIIYATALSTNAVLWTQDADFAELEGVKYFTK